QRRIVRALFPQVEFLRRIITGSLRVVSVIDFILGGTSARVFSSQMDYERANSTLGSKAAFPCGSFHHGIVVVHVGIESDSPRAVRTGSGDLFCRWFGSSV